MTPQKESSAQLTPCGHAPNDADCEFCLKMKECKEMRKVKHDVR